MSKYSVPLDSDANFHPIYRGEYPFRTKKTITFAGGTTDAIGDDGGALDPFNIFIVTGLIRVRLMAYCTTDLTGANGTVCVGISGATTLFMPVETATQIDSGQLWVNDAANGTSIIIGEEQAAVDNLPEYLLAGTNIIGTIGTADVTGGVLDFYAEWCPISDDANLVAA